VTAAHAVAADTDDDGGTSAVLEFRERRAADQVELDRRALVDRFRERIETARRVGRTYGTYQWKPAVIAAFGNRGMDASASARP
jgi:hypothetical protein